MSASTAVAHEIPRGAALLHDPVWNKGTAFSEAERDALGLRGLLPPRVLSLQAQVDRAMEILAQKPNDLERYIYLIALQDRNETLFYRVVIEHLQELMPIIYTPTVGRACELYGHIFRRPRGIWISASDRGHVADVLANWPYREEVRIIVVTDGERILGLGDLGADGMGIPVGKLALYTACAGIPPTSCLPVTIDVGTNNEALRRDPLYIGLPRPRIDEAAYDALIDEFMTTAAAMFPRAVIQLEDFANKNAFRLLDRYRDRFCVFDDDIQGTAGVVLAGLLAAGRIHGLPLADQRLLFVGAGEAGIGIANLVVAALEREGIDAAEARTRCWFFDSRGMVVSNRADLAPFKRPFAHDHPFTNNLVTAIAELRPTAIIGASGQPGLFNQSVVEAMARINERPVVFALSNPTSKSECSAHDAHVWSSGRAIFASGSPFPPVVHDGCTIVPGQANNAYVFPGVGLGAVVCEARYVTDEMFFEAARALAGQVSATDLAAGSVFPPIGQIREVSARIALAVCEVAWHRGLAGIAQPADPLALIRESMFQPGYASYV